MKKEYINPTIEVVKIHAAQLLAGSDVSAALDDENTQDNSDALGHGNFFDFGEDD